MKKNYLNDRFRFKSENRSKGMKNLLGLFSLFAMLFMAQTGFSQISYNYGWEPTGDGGWTASTGFFSRTTANPCTDLGSYRANIYNGSTSTLISPVLTGSNGGDLTLQFNYKAVDYSSPTTGVSTAAFGTLKVEHATSLAGPWTTFHTINSANHVVSGTCATVTVVKTGVSAGGDNYFRFVNTAGANSDLYIYFDDVVVTQGAAPSCLSPSTLNISNLTQTSATLGWTEPGSATDWDVEYGVAGFTPTGVPTLPSTTNPTNIGSLTPFTDYEFYVRSICSPTDMSSWSGPFAFYTGYCHVSTSYTGDYTSNFSTSTAVNNVTYTATANPVGSYSNQTTQNFTSFPTQEIEFKHSYVGGNNSYKVWIDWNNDLDFEDAGEMMSSYLGVSSPHNGSFTVPAGTPPGAYGVRVRSVYDYNGSVNVSPCGLANYGTTIDFVLNVAPSPTCMPPSALTISALTATSVNLGWQENGSATDWEIEYGALGFTPTGVATLSTTTNPTAVTGFASNTDFSFYVRAMCSTTDTSFWVGPYSFLTLCEAVSAQSFCEDFETTSSSINCWRALDGNNDGKTWNLYTGAPNSGTISAGIETDGNAGANDDYLISPNMILTGNEVIKFSYRVMSIYEPNDFQVLLSTTGTAAADFQDTILSLGQYSNIEYKDTAINLSAFTGNVYIAFHVPAGGVDGYVLFIDDVCFDICTPNAGVAGSQTICSLTPTIDLNSVITPGETNGVWEYNTNPNALNGSDLTLAAMPFGTFEFDYIVTTACVSDTTRASITVVKPSSAGQDGTLAVCRNQPFNLLGGLTGNGDFGGVWTDPNAVVVPNGNAISANIPGQYNYKYIVNNGVCPNDTAKVVVTVQGCDYLGLEDVVFEGFSMYPNPTSDLVFITNTGSAEVFNYEVLDMNGRVIMNANKAINGSTTTELDMSKVDSGIYLVRVFNEKAEKTFRIVKN